MIEPHMRHNRQVNAADNENDCLSCSLACLFRLGDEASGHCPNCLHQVDQDSEEVENVELVRDVGQVLLLALRRFLHWVIFVLLCVTDCLLSNRVVPSLPLKGQVHEACRKNYAHNELGCREPDVHTLLPGRLHF